MDKIICLGKNYTDHAQEMQEAIPAKPVLFIKPPSTLVEPKLNSTVFLPFERGVIHHEIEVVFKLYKKNVIALTVGLDLTFRNEQKILKEQGHPWEKAKVFTNSSIIAPFVSQKDFPNWYETPFTLKVNGEITQSSSLNKAILDPNAIIHYIDEFFPIRDGDLVFTGTPSGVGPLHPQDKIELIWGAIHHTFTLGTLYEQT